MTGELQGLRAIVTGGSSGIGRAVVEEFLREGADVAVLDLVVDDVSEGARGYVADVTDRASVDAAVTQAVADMSGLDIVVNNAGIAAIGTVEELGEDDWSRVLDVNVTGIARVSAAALPRLRESAHAAIVNMCSIGALNGLPRRALYNASKGAVLSLTYAMATDHVREGIRVNAVSPGTVFTPFVERFLTQFEDPVAERAALDARQATGRMVSTAEVAQAVVYLASPRSGSTVGTVLDVDGGVTHLRVRSDR